MTLLLALAALVIAGAISVLLGVLVLESLAALSWNPSAAKGQPEQDSSVPTSVVVLIPAQNEAARIAATIQAVQAEAVHGWQILVIAHNCDDDTALVARDAGARVLTLRDGGDLGKPAALRLGIAELERESPEIVLILDADCLPERGALTLLAQQSQKYQQPCMPAYLLAASPEGGAFSSVSSGACWIKNFLRPLGLYRMGLPCLISGSGVVMPFGQLRSVEQGQGSIAEDYQLTIDLLRKGHATRFVPLARVHSGLPSVQGSAMRQRTRWEHGHLQLTLVEAPRLLLEALWHRSFYRFVIGLELLTPPISLLGLGWCLVLIGILALQWFLGWGGAVTWAFWLHLGSAILCFSAVTAALLRFRGAKSTFSFLAHLPAYALSKLSIYLGFLWSRERNWRRTDR
ncbi:MAG: hypothetical protein CSA62_14310 [Planctomycetota bacterium]|nr:MAG: hypothetical protein CSA62_14310 [Planctomycetota bacterium]